MRWRRGIHVLTRRRGEVQIGTDPRWAVRVGGLDRAEARMLCALSDLTDVPLEGLAHQHGVAADRARELQRLLTEARLLAPPAAHRLGTQRDPVPARLGDDLQVHSLLADDADGGARVGARASRVVRIEGLGRTGTVLAGALAAAGVGRLELVDDRVVGPHEPGVGGILERDVGAAREQVAARIVTGSTPGVSTARGSRSAIDVVVLVDSYATDPERALEWLGARVSVLPVVVREADTVVGPFVSPAGSPCLRCVGLHLVDVDRDWPLLVAQLCARGRRAPAPQESLLAQLTGVFAASQVVAALDGHEPVTVGASFELALPQPVGLRRSWSTHPSCECVDQPLA